MSKVCSKRLKILSWDKSNVHLSMNVEGVNEYLSDTIDLKQITKQNISLLHNPSDQSFVSSYNTQKKQKKKKEKEPLESCNLYEFSINYYIQTVDQTYNLVTKVIDILPKYVIINQCQGDLHVMQEGGN